jgi:glycosyltransferase involved in cell wall biosynthesis
MYPPVDTAYFETNPGKFDESPFPSGSYLLSVGRLVGYKRFDRVIRACIKNNIPLVVIGSGREERALKSQSSGNIRFITKSLTDRELRQYYHNCRGFVFGGKEDFGIVAVEALAAGKGVLCPRQSGMAEGVREGITGMLFDDTSETEFDTALKRFFDTSYDRHACQTQARKFEKSKFMKDFRAFVESSVLSYNRRI